MFGYTVFKPCNNFAYRRGRVLRPDWALYCKNHMDMIGHNNVFIDLYILYRLGIRLIYPSAVCPIYVRRSRGTEAPSPTIDERIFFLSSVQIVIKYAPFEE